MSDAVTHWLMSPGRGEQLPSLEDWLQRPAWHQDAACRSVGPDAFIRSPKADYGATRPLCDGCAVRQECLEAALADPDLVGLWGGTTDAERRAMRRGRVA
jgi:WhiB family transcriptional regulator, redox-sensing transcriptional regulator